MVSRRVVNISVGNLGGTGTAIGPFMGFLGVYRRSSLVGLEVDVLGPTVVEHSRSSCCQG